MLLTLPGCVLHILHGGLTAGYPLSESQTQHALGECFHWRILICKDMFSTPISSFPMASIATANPKGCCIGVHQGHFLYKVISTVTLWGKMASMNINTIVEFVVVMVNGEVYVMISLSLFPLVCLLFSHSPTLIHSCKYAKLLTHGP